MRAAQCGMEVVLANGDVVRTGMGGIDTGSAWQLYQPGYGPSFDSMFMQSNYGVVTKMGIWLMPAPPAYLLGEIQFRDEHDLEAIVDILRPLRLDETIRNYAVIEGGLRRAAGVSPRSQWYDGDGAMPEEAIDAMLNKLQVGRWNLHFALYGTPELIDARYAIVQRAFSRVPRVSFSAKQYAGDAQPAGGGDRNQAGIPAMTAFRMLDWRGGAGAHIDFSPICPATGRDAMRQYTMTKARAAEYGFRLLRRIYRGRAASASHLCRDLRSQRCTAERAGGRPAACVEERRARGRLWRIPLASGAYGLRGPRSTASMTARCCVFRRRSRMRSIRQAFCHRGSRASGRERGAASAAIREGR